MTPVSIDIGVCTFRRAHLSRTLESMAALDVPPGTIIRVIAADNDTEPSATGIVQQMRSAFPFELVYLHCPASNISLARNTCLDASANSDYLAFVDDDETVSPQWLRELLAVALETKAHAVLGPVHATYGASLPGWLAAGDFHSTNPVFVRGEIITGYTCNVLIKRAGRAAPLRFNLKRGRTGGEDTEYFTRLHQLGGQIAFAPGALVFEDVPPERARMSWLIARRKRAGQSHGAIMIETTTASRVGVALSAAAKAAYSFGAAALTAASPVRRRANILRGMLHIGVVSSALGSSEAVQYGAGPSEILSRKA